VIDRRSVPAVLSLLVGLAACGGEQPERRTGSISPRQAQERARDSLGPELIAAIDSGNTRYREGEHEAARAHFRRVLERDSTVAAAWFGVYMTERALGNQDAADRALQRAAEMTDDRTMLRSTRRDTPATGSESGGGRTSGSDSARGQGGG